jgi:hypothetical protein
MRMRINLCPVPGDPGVDEGEDDQPDDAESLLPGHEDLEGAVNLAVDASEACEACKNDIDRVPELIYETECFSRVRRLVFTMAGLVPADATLTDKIEWDTFGPVAVMLDDNLIVAWPIEETERYPRSAEIGGLLSIPIKNVVPRV